MGAMVSREERESGGPQRLEALLDDYALLNGLELPDGLDGLYRLPFITPFD